MTFARSLWGVVSCSDQHSSAESGERKLARQALAGKQLPILSAGEAIYSGVEIREVTPAGVRILHSEGVTHIALENLPTQPTTGRDSSHDYRRCYPDEKQRKVEIEVATHPRTGNAAHSTRRKSEKSKATPRRKRDRPAQAGANGTITIAPASRNRKCIVRGDLIGNQTDRILRAAKKVARA